MTTWFEFLEGGKTVGDILEFKKSDREVEHVDSTTIVERIEMTPELQAEFEAAGYAVETGEKCENRKDKR